MDPSSERTGKGDSEIRYVRSPDLLSVFIGLCILVSIYFLPLFPIPDEAGSLLTLATVVASCPSLPGVCNPMQPIAFWLGWAVSLGLIAAGIFAKKPDLSFER